MDDLGDRFVVHEELGHGGMGIVYRAFDTLVERTVAVKVLLDPDPSLVQRMQREAKVLGQLTHPHIVEFIDIDVDSRGRTLLILEYVQGTTLKDTPLKGLHHALEVVAQVCDALAFAHSHHVIHRDIKPGNIMITPAGDVRVLDFGLARRNLHGDSQITKTGQALGTPAYMAPEQALGRPVDAAADLYAVGILLYELCCGTPPFVGDNGAEVLLRHITDVPVPPRQLNPSLPEELEILILQLLEKEAPRRPASAQAVRDTLRRIAAAVKDQPAPSSVALTDEPPFVGRRSELAAVWRCYDDLAQGRSSLLIVWGPAGSGRTRLLMQSAAYAASRGLQWVHAPVEAHRQESPWKPLVDALYRGGWEQCRRPPDVSQAVSLASGEVAWGSELKDGRQRTLGVNLCRALACIAGHQPTVVCFDDLERGHSELLEWLEQFCRRGFPPGLSLVVTVADEGGMRRQTLREACGEGRVAVDELALGPLDMENALLLVRTMLGRDVETDLIPSILELTHLYPRALVEAARFLGLNTTSLEMTRTALLELPERLRRTDDLSSQAQLALEWAALLGSRFEAATVEGLMGLSEGALAEDFRRQVVAGRVRPGWELDVPILEFVDTELMQRMLEALGEAERRRRHGQILHHLKGASPMVLAQHAAGAGLPMEAVTWWREAAQRARAGLAWQSAAQYVERALELADGHPQVQAELYLELFSLDAMRKPLVERMAHLEKAMQAICTLPRQAGGAADGLMLRIQHARLDAMGRLGDIEQALEEGLVVLATLPDDPPWTARFCDLIASLQERQEQYEAALQTVERGLAAQETCQLLLTRAQVCGALGRPEAAYNDLSRALETARRDGDPALLLPALNDMAMWHSEHRPAEEAVGYMEEALELARSQQDPRWMGGILSNLALVDINQGRFEDAATRLREALAVQEAATEPEVVAYTHANLAEALLFMGAPNDAMFHIEQMDRMAAELGLSHLHQHGRLLRARMYLDQARYADVWRELAELDDPAGVLLKAEVMLAEVGCGARPADDLGPVLKEVETADAAFTACGDRRNRALGRRIRGSLLARQGDVASALASLEDAASELGALGHHYEQAVTALHAGRILQPDVDPARISQVRGWMVAALKVFNTVGATQLASQCREQIRHLNR